MPIKSIFIFIFVLAISVSTVFAASDTSLTDLSFGSLSSQAPGGERNPFAADASGTGLDPSTLSLEGLIIGPGVQLARISGKVVREGNALGTVIVKEIKTGQVLIQSEKGITTLSMENYLPGTGSSTGALFEVSFHNADLKKAVRMLATAGDFNLIMPESLEGRVSVVFHQIMLKDSLGSVLRVNGLEYAEENDVIRVGKAESFAGGAYFSTQQFPLRYATAKDLMQTVKSHLSEKGTATADDRTNTLIVKDNQSVLSNVSSLISTLDRQDKQVHIEAKIVDVTKNFTQSLGIQWGFTKTEGKVQGMGASGAGAIAGSTDPVNVNLPAANPTSGVGILIGNIFNQTDLSAQITAAESKGDAHIISQPSITTVNNTPAKIRSGVKIFVKSTSTIAVGGSSGSSSASDSGLEEIDTGIELTVTPQISSDNSIKLKIDAVESEADYSRTVDGVPAVIDNTASTTVLVRDGETTVIGGLMKINKNNMKNGTPFASNIPILGWFFKSNTKTKTDNELLIFITPRLVSSDAAPPALQPEVSVLPTNQEILNAAYPPKTEKKTKSSGKKRNGK